MKTKWCEVTHWNRWAISLLGLLVAVETDTMIIKCGAWLTFCRKGGNWIVRSSGYEILGKAV